jgi:hypothetical protein
VAAAIRLHHERVPRAVVRKVVELSDNGMSTSEISSIVGLPLPLIVLILRGAPPGVRK